MSILFKASISLTKHLQRCHKNEEEVKSAMILPRPEKNRTFCNLKRQGVFKYNAQIMKSHELDTSSTTVLMKERKQSDKELAMCSLCNAFISKSLMHIRNDEFLKKKIGLYEFKHQSLSNFKFNEKMNALRSKLRRLARLFIHFCYKIWWWMNFHVIWASTFLFKHIFSFKTAPFQTVGSNCTNEMKRLFPQLRDVKKLSANIL